MVQLLRVQLGDIVDLFPWSQSVPEGDGMAPIGQFFDDRNEEVGVAVGRVRRQEEDVGSAAQVHIRQREQQKSDGHLRIFQNWKRLDS